MVRQDRRVERGVMSNETPENIANDIIQMTPDEFISAIKLGNYTEYFLRLEKRIAEAIRKERVVSLPKVEIETYGDTEPSPIEEMFYIYHEQLKKLNEGKTFVEVVE